MKQKEEQREKNKNRDKGKGDSAEDEREEQVEDGEKNKRRKERGGSCGEQTAPFCPALPWRGNSHYRSQLLAAASLHPGDMLRRYRECPL